MGSPEWSEVYKQRPDGTFFRKDVATDETSKINGKPKSGGGGGGGGGRKQQKASGKKKRPRRGDARSSSAGSSIDDASPQCKADDTSCNVRGAGAGGMEGTTLGHEDL
jgi:hypothetical protein